MAVFIFFVAIVLIKLSLYAFAMHYQAIGIAGNPGAGKTELIKLLLKHPMLASWNSCSTGDLLRKRHDSLAKQNIFTGSFADYLARGLEDDEIIILNNEARALAKKGNCLLDSRYAVENCRQINALLVFLTAPLEIRAERKARGDKIRIAEIRADLNKRADWELETGLRLFGYDYNDMSRYNLVLYTDKLTLEEEVDVIVKRLKENHE